MRAAALLLIGLALSACGQREALRVAPGEAPPIRSAAAPRAPTTDELLAPAPQTRPERSDELLRRSEKRGEDRFDLPPPG